MARCARNVAHIRRQVYHVPRVDARHCVTHLRDISLHAADKVEVFGYHSSVPDVRIRRIHSCWLSAPCTAVLRLFSFFFKEADDDRCDRLNVLLVGGCPYKPHCHTSSKDMEY